MSIIDNIQLQLPETVFRLKDSYFDPAQVLSDSMKSGKSVLKFRAPVTYSGMRTNYRVYPGPKMQKGVDSWVTPFPKPVLRHHRSGKYKDDPTEDPLGRVVEARYIQTASNEDWLRDDQFPKAAGTGFVEVVANVTDQAAIEKVLDKRYLTLSVGFDSPILACSVCGKNWKSAGPCKHTPGVETILEDSITGTKIRKIPHLITGDLFYEELSFVNRPANPNAYIQHFEFVQDKLVDSCIYSPPMTSSLICDEVSFDGKVFIGMKPNEKETITISTDNVSTNDNVQKPNIKTSTLQSTNDNTEVQTPMTEPTGSAPAVAPVATTDSKVENDVSKQLLLTKDAEIDSLKKETAALKDQVAILSAEVQKGLARRLLDLRLQINDPTVEAVKADSAKYNDTIVEYAKRSRISLEDALRDEEIRVSAIKKAPIAKPEVKPVARNSVNMSDAGVQVDTTKDVPKLVDAKPVKSATEYKSGLAARFKGLS